MPLRKDRKMKQLINSLFISLSMYSVLPAPQKAWDESNMKYVMAFMPVPGLICGLLMYLFASFAVSHGVNPIFFAAVMAVIPVLITGGLHLDGFADTVDAVSSHKDMETKLKILKDPNSGAFAVIYTVCYFTVTVGLWSQYSENPVFIWAIPIIYCMSKVLGALFVVGVEPARKSGLAYMFSSGADKKWSSNVLYLELFALLLLLLGGSFELFAAIFAVICLAATVFVRQVKRLFGGITGDLIGFFICISELMFLIVLTVFSMI